MPSTESYDGTGVEYFAIPAFTFSSGEKMDVKVAYRSFNPEAKKTVLVRSGWLIASRVHSLIFFPYLHK